MNLSFVFSDALSANLEMTMPRVKRDLKNKKDRFD
jgi:hypothetical protein